MSDRPASALLQDAAERVLDYDGPAVPLNLDALVNALEHAAVLAAEHEYAAAHGTVRSDFGHAGEPAYPPLVSLLAQVAVVDEPIVVPQLEPDVPLAPWEDAVATASCPCGWRAWLGRNASDEDHVQFRAEADEHLSTCTAVPA